MTKASDVYFIGMRSRTAKDNPVAKVKKLFEAAGFKKIVQSNDLTAVKAHFGEPGGYTHIRPVFVRAVVDKLKEAGCKPFLTDSGTLYSGRRHNAVEHLITAEEHGFGLGVTGAPTVIADGLRGDYTCEVEIGCNHFKKVHISGIIAEADSMMVLSHFKGHELAGFGGAIKNLAMGCAPAIGKAVQHHVRLHVNREHCVSCGLCLKICPESAISMVDCKAEINPQKCTSCGECYSACTTKAIELDWETDIPAFMERMTEYALGAVKDKQGRLGFINFIMDVTPDCDCAPWSDSPIVPNIGIAASNDPVALDKACWDLVNQAQGLGNTHMNNNHTPGEDKFAGLWPHTKPGIQISYGEAIGLGCAAYNLKTI